MWESQEMNFTAPKKVNIYFCLPEFSVTKILAWKFHVDNQTNSRYDIILDRDLITALVLDLKFSDNIIIGFDGPYEGC